MLKNKRLYNLFFKEELKKLCYKSIFFNRNLPTYIRQKAYVSLKNNSSKSFITKKRNCLITTSSRSITNHFKISRIKLRMLFSNNYINGIKKY